MPSFVIALIALVIFVFPAEATAISSVQGAFWQTDFSYYDDGTSRSTALPGGIVLLCTGTAVSDGMGGCRDSADATAVSSNGMPVSTVVDRYGALTLMNTRGVPLSGVFSFTAKYAAFYPAATGSGASVDNGATETADYFTFVSGAGGFDLHGCNMVGSPGHGGPHVCRPPSPEMFDSSFTLGPMAADGTLTADWRIYIQVDATGDSDPVPEPPALALFMAGMVAATGYRRKVRSPSRQSRRPAW